MLFSSLMFLWDSWLCKWIGLCIYFCFFLLLLLFFLGPFPFVCLICLVQCFSILCYYYLLKPVCLLQRQKVGEFRREGIWEELLGVEGRETLMQIYYMGKYVFSKWNWQIEQKQSGLCVVQVLGCFGKKKLKHSAELHSKILHQQQPQATKTWENEIRRILCIMVEWQISKYVVEGKSSKTFGIWSWDWERVCTFLPQSYGDDSLSTSDLVYFPFINKAPLSRPLK